MNSIKTMFVIAGGVALGLAGANAAGAAMYSTGQFGTWTSMQGTADNTNRSMCEVMNSWSNAVLAIKYAGNQTAFIDISKAGWSIPNGQPVSVQLQVDSAPPLTLNGYGINGFNATTGASYSGFEVALSTNDRSPISGNWLAVDVVNLIKAGVSLHLYFPNGSEPPWSATLAGSTPAVNNFQACLRTAFLSAPAYSQPYGGFDIATQPYVAQRSQPF